MSLLGGNDEPAPRARRASGAAWSVAGRRYSNSAAKFWSALLDEFLERHAGCDELELCAVADRALRRDLLRPEAALEEALANPPAESLEEVMRATAFELAVFGAPGVVTARLLAHGAEVRRCVLPAECVDTEIFPLMLVWPLEWAGLPAAAWNVEVLDGAFIADATSPARRYDVEFRLCNTPAQEGLIRRAFTVSARRTARATDDGHRPR
jgi:hypothetical protein